MSTTPLVEFRRAGIGYDGQSVLHVDSLRVNAGEFVGVVGPSGSGKTTLLRGLLGIAHVYQGEVLVDGRCVTPRSRVAVGYVPQINTIDWMFPITVEEAVLLGNASNMWGPWMSRKVTEREVALLERLGIAHLRHKHIRNLSGGQQQRVFIARALLRNPRLVVLDEPTSGVDIKTRDDILHLLAELNNDGTTILMATHELNAVAAHLPRVVCIRGKVIADGTPIDVFTEGVLSETFGGQVVVVRDHGRVIVAETPHGFRETLDRHSHEHEHQHVDGHEHEHEDTEPEPRR